MASKTFRVLATKGDKEYVFDSIAFKVDIGQFVAAKREKGEKIKRIDVKNDIADITYTTPEAVNNWMYGRNGIYDLQTVKKIAEYLQVDYMSLLKVKENNKMVTNTVNSTGINMDNTKDVLRNVYQAMSKCMDAERRDTLFSTEESWGECLRLYKDAETALHAGMMDIPSEIYKRLVYVLYGFEIYVYGIDGGLGDFWCTSEYDEFLERKNSGANDDNIDRWMYIDYKSEKFYENMRDILKDYITA